jgi:uncharacterized membrane protein
MRKILFLIIICLFFFSAVPVFAQQHPQLPQQNFYKAKVIKIVKEGLENINGTENRFQTIEVKILEGSLKGKIITLQNGGQTTITSDQKVKVGDTIVVSQMMSPVKGVPVQYTLYDKYRLNILLYIFIVFALLVVLIAGWRGLGSILGLLISLAIILLYIIPQIVHGHDPLWTSVWGSLAILLITTYLAHGISKKTTAALLSTFIALMLTVFLSSFLVSLAGLNGTGNEDAATLQFGVTSIINLKGLLLGGIIIGTLGALNDVTTSQAAAVFEFAAMDPLISLKTLFLKGFTVGKEHAASMVNTLVLAYAGSALALFIFFIVNPLKIPYWVILNSEFTSEEIVRTLAGTIGILLVVPIVTFLAAVMCLYLKLEGTFKDPSVKIQDKGKYFKRTEKK